MSTSNDENDSGTSAAAGGGTGGAGAPTDDALDPLTGEGDGGGRPFFKRPAVLVVLAVLVGGTTATYFATRGNSGGEGGQVAETDKAAEEAEKSTEVVVLNCTFVGASSMLTCAGSLEEPVTENFEYVPATEQPAAPVAKAKIRLEVAGGGKVYRSKDVVTFTEGSDTNLGAVTFVLAGR